MAKVRRFRAGGHDKRVVGNTVVPEQDAAAGEVEATNLGHQNRNIRVPFQHGPQRRRNVGRRQPARGHLVQERLKEVKVPPVDEGHMDRALRSDWAQ